MKCKQRDGRTNTTVVEGQSEAQIYLHYSTEQHSLCVCLASDTVSEAATNNRVWLKRSRVGCVYDHQAQKKNQKVLIV